LTAHINNNVAQMRHIGVKEKMRNVNAPCGIPGAATIGAVAHISKHADFVSSTRRNDPASRNS